MKSKKTICDEITDALNFWDTDRIVPILEDVYELYKLYDTYEGNDWVIDKVGRDDHVNIRLIRTVYLISKLADKHSGSLVGFKVKFPKLWERMEKHSDRISNE